MRIAIITIFALLLALLVVEAAPLMERKIKAIKALKAPKKVAAPKKVTPPPAIPKKVAVPKKAATPKKIAIPKTAATPKKVTTPKKVAIPKKATTPKKVTTPTKAPSPAKAKTVTPAKVSAKPSAKATPAAKACQVRRPGAVGKKAGVSVKGRADVDPVAAECAALDTTTCAGAQDCNTCVGIGGLTTPGVKCVFTIDNKCVPGNRNALGQIATDRKQCTELAEQQEIIATTTTNGIIKAAAARFYRPKIENHILGVDEEKSTSTGRHLRSIWTSANTGSKVIKRNFNTGIILFDIPNSTKSNRKTVWSDEADQDVIYTKEDVQRVCEAALAHSIKKDLGGGALEGTPEAAELKKPVKPVKPNKLKPVGGNQTGFITKDPKTDKLMCINVSKDSCFPFSLGSVTLKPTENEGDTCEEDHTNDTD